ncbi:MAG: hypothetical protein Q4E57_05300 [Eubacteriales bacterium]|nr:hypothetical protein [Eubacteriales bacterium]
MSERERSIILELKDDEAVRVGDICTSCGLINAAFSKYRERLLHKGLITSERHGYVKPALPRFRCVCEYYI